MADDDRFLKQRNGWWYVRVRVPPRLKEPFGTHLVEALHTKNKTLARELRWPVVAALKAKLAAMKTNPVKATAEIWRRRHEEDPTGFDYTGFHKVRTRFERQKGLAASVEFVQRAYNWITDLDHGEAEWFAAEQFDSKTEARYRHSIALLGHHIREQGLTPGIQSVDAKLAMSFRNELVQQGKHRRTADSYLSALRSRWQYWVDGGVTETNPWRDIRMPKPRRGHEPPRRMWQDKELEQLFKGDCSPALFDYMAILVLTGCRRDEILEHAELDDGWLKIQGGKSAAAVRRVPVAKILQNGIARALDRIRREGRSGNAWTQHFMRYRRSIGLNSSTTTLHSFRHSFSTLADDAGIQKHQVKAVIGHSKGDVTDIYLRVSNENRISVVEAVFLKLPDPVRSAISNRFSI